MQQNFHGTKSYLEVSFTCETGGAEASLVERKSFQAHHSTAVPSSSYEVALESPSTK